MIKVTLFARKDVPSQDAQSIYSAIKSNLEHLLSEIVFLGSDGDSVSTGIKNGLITTVRQ